MRVGWGVDAHRFSPDGEVLIAGVVADDSRGVEATSDGDVAVHALIDAVLGAAALGDIGMHFPPGDLGSQDAGGLGMLARVVGMVADHGFVVESVDITVVAQSVRVAPIRDEARARLAEVLGLGVDRISLKATTTDELGFTGRDEGIAALAVAVLGER